MRRDTGRTPVNRASLDSEECHAAVGGAFVYDAPQSRVVFGFGTVAQLGYEAERLGIRRAVVLTTPQQRGEGERIGARLGSRFAGVFSDAKMHTPVEVTEAAGRVAEAN